MWYVWIYNSNRNVSYSRQKRKLHICARLLLAVPGLVIRVLIKKVFYANFQIPRITSLTSSRGQALPSTQSYFNHLLLSCLYASLLIRKPNWAVQWSEWGKQPCGMAVEGNLKPWVAPKERVAISSFITKQTICFKSTSNADPPGPTLLTFRVKAAYRRGLILLHKYEIIN